MNATTAAAPAASTSTSSAPAAPATPARIPRIRKKWDLAELFPEVPAIVRHQGRFQMGFADAAAGGVPSRIPGFIQESDFLMEFVSFMCEPDRWMFTLFGPTGCGKTERCLDYFARLNVPVFRFDAHKTTKLHEIVADLRPRADGTLELLPKVLYRAMKGGYPIVINEVYKLNPGITSKLHEIRDRGQLYIDETGETLVAKPGFKFIATANHAGLGDDTGMYVGDETQDMAWLNGSLVFECGYPKAEVEEQVVQRVLVERNPIFGSDPALSQYAKHMVAVANAARAASIANAGPTLGRIELPFSTRNLVMWAQMFVSFSKSIGGSTGDTHPLYRSLDSVMARRGCQATRNALDGFVQAHFGINRVIP